MVARDPSKPKPAHIKDVAVLDAIFEGRTLEETFPAMPPKVLKAKLKKLQKRGLIKSGFVDLGKTSLTRRGVDVHEGFHDVFALVGEDGPTLSCFVEQLGEGIQDRPWALKSSLFRLG